MKSNSFQQAFQQVRYTFHSFFLHILLELVLKPLKGNIPIATIPLFERQTEEDKVKPLWNHPQCQVVALRKFMAILLFMATGSVFHISCLFFFFPCIWNASSSFSAVLCFLIPLLIQISVQLEITVSFGNILFVCFFFNSIPHFLITLESFVLLHQVCLSTLFTASCLIVCR